MHNKNGSRNPHILLTTIIYFKTRGVILCHKLPLPSKRTIKCKITFVIVTVSLSLVLFHITGFPNSLELPDDMNFNIKPLFAALTRSGYSLRH